ncbi:hypothetical protein [Burkholderia sp. GS2Y]|uniref:Uncharacterized protein n=1 Tax=Burkholderia theae TaxID=3143496 RepID=A0ABU9WII9_9BURK
MRRLADDLDGIVDSLEKLATENEHAIKLFGARVIVLFKFVEVALPRLTSEQCTAIAEPFRAATERALFQLNEAGDAAPELRRDVSKQMRMLLGALRSRAEAAEADLTAS